MQEVRALWCRVWGEGFIRTGGARRVVWCGVGWQHLGQQCVWCPPALRWVAAMCSSRGFFLTLCWGGLSAVLLPYLVLGSPVNSLSVLRHVLETCCECRPLNSSRSAPSAQSPSPQTNLHPALLFDFHKPLGNSSAN